MFKVTESKECPTGNGAAYRHFIAGNVYGPETDPPGTPFVEARALAEGWAVAWPPAPAAEPASPEPAPPLPGAVSSDSTEPDPILTEPCHACGMRFELVEALFSHACQGGPALPTPDPDCNVPGELELSGLARPFLRLGSRVIDLAQGEDGVYRTTGPVRETTADDLTRWELGHGEPISGLSDEQRAALPKLEPTGTGLDMAFAVGFSEPKPAPQEAPEPEKADGDTISPDISTPAGQEAPPGSAGPDAQAAPENPRKSAPAKPKATSKAKSGKQAK